VWFFNVYIHARIEPDNAFRVVLKVAKYAVDGEYGLIEMAEQKHELWLDRSRGYSLSQFYDDMATKIIWGPSQTLALWVVDRDTSSEWKIRWDDHWLQMLKDKWDERMAHIIVEVVNKDGYDTQMASKASNSAPPRFDVTNAEASYAGTYAEGAGDTCTSPPGEIPLDQDDEPVPVDWESLTILAEGDQDGDIREIVDEELIYEAMGFKDKDERAEDIPIPGMSSEVQGDTAEAAIPVDDTEATEPLFDWDRDNPDMYEFRLAVKQYAIVNEFELGTEKSDKTRFRGYCKASGCPWIIRARTQHDKSVRVHIF